MSKAAVLKTLKLFFFCPILFIYCDIAIANDKEIPIKFGNNVLMKELSISSELKIQDILLRKVANCNWGNISVGVDKGWLNPLSIDESGYKIENYIGEYFGVNCISDGYIAAGSIDGLTSQKRNTAKALLVYFNKDKTISKTVTHDTPNTYDAFFDVKNDRKNNIYAVGQIVSFENAHPVIFKYDNELNLIKINKLKINGFGEHLHIYNDSIYFVVAHSNKLIKLDLDLNIISQIDLKKNVNNHDLFYWGVSEYMGFLYVYGRDDGKAVIIKLDKFLKIKARYSFLVGNYYSFVNGLQFEGDNLIALVSYGSLWQNISDSHRKFFKLSKSDNFKWSFVLFRAGINNGLINKTFIMPQLRGDEYVEYGLGGRGLKYTNNRSVIFLKY